MKRLASILVILAGTAAIAWTSLAGWGLPAIGERQPDYYNLLVGGFRKGSLALDIEVPEALRRAKDPIAFVEQSPGLIPHDISYFNGHYYTYYGVVPAVVLFWPFRVLTGRELPLVLGSLAFGIGAFLLAAWLWLRLVRDHFPRAGVATRIAGIAVFGLAGGQWVLARRVSIWEPSIEAGNFFLMCMLASGYRALHARRPWGWLACCGVFLGLATGSRPTLSAAGLGLVVLVAAVGWARGKAGPAFPARRLLNTALAAGLPLAAVVAGLLAYNWARFGNPLELGLNHQLSPWNSVPKSHFRASYIPFNLFLYFLASPQWGRYFPFVHPIARPALPSGYYGYEYVYGALIVCPVLWLGALVPPFVRRADPALRSFAAVVLGIAVGTTLVILCFDTSAARYETDFMPWWVLLALLGWCLLEDRMRPAGTRAARLPTLGFLALALFSCLTAFCSSVELHGVLEKANPAAYRRLSRVFNTPTGLWERLTGYRGGAVEMNLAFAKRPLGSLEPLVVTGVEYQKDYVYVFYQKENVVRFCYMHPGEPVASSDDVSVEAGRTYPVRIECGSLYPPEGHPAFDGWQPVEVDSFKRWVKVDFNGHTVLIDSRRSNDASPGTVQIGIDQGVPYCGRRFAGAISGVRRMGWARPEGDLRPAGDFNLTVALPRPPSPVDLPLLTAGRRGLADLVGIGVDDPSQYRFVYEGWGVGLWGSRFLTIPQDRLVSFRVRFGPTLRLDASSPLGILARSIVIWQNGAPVWWHRTAVPLETDPPFQMMANSVDSTAIAPTFRGRLVSASRTPIGSVWHMGPFAALDLQLGGRGDGGEPLAATGTAGHSDTLVINWLGAGRARLLYDHRGAGIRSSGTFGWADDTLKSMRIEMPSFASLDATGRTTGAGPLRVRVDGTTVWEEDVPFYRASSNEVAVGRNSSGCPAAGAELRCVVVDLHQDPHN